MASPDRAIIPRLEPMASPRQLAALADELLEEIFLRVATHADLARASTACVSFRRVIADPSFQRRYRCRHRHPPLLLGFLGFGGAGFHPVEAPHPNAPVARAFGNAADFSYDYLPNSTELGWSPCDVRHSRVLLEGSPAHGNAAGSFALPELALCDPLSRQYLLLPRMPADLLASVQIEERDIDYLDDSFLPSGDWEETSFRVLRTIKSTTRLVVCVFSSTSGCWSVGASTSSDDVLSFNIPRRTGLKRPQFAYGCCYWKVRDVNKLLKLDMDTMEFSTIDLQPELYNQSIAIVEVGEGNLGMFTPNYDREGEGISVEYYTFTQNGSGRANEWHMNNTTPLCSPCKNAFIGLAEGYLFLAHPSYFNGPSHTDYVCFSLKTKTSNIARVSKMGSSSCYPYFGFPPFISSRRIQGYEVMLQG